MASPLSPESHSAPSLHSRNAGSNQPVPRVPVPPTASAPRSPPVSEAMPRPLRVRLACSPPTLRPSLTCPLPRWPTSRRWRRPLCPVAWAHPAAEGHAASEGGLGPTQGSPSPPETGRHAGGAALLWGGGRTGVPGERQPEQGHGCEPEPGQARAACGWSSVKGRPGGRVVWGQRGWGEPWPPGAVPAPHAPAGLTGGTAGEPGSGSSLRGGDRRRAETGAGSLPGLARPRPTRNPPRLCATRPHTLVVGAVWQPRPRVA